MLKLATKKKYRVPHWGSCPDDLKGVHEAIVECVAKPSPEHELAAAVFAESIIDLQRGPVDGWAVIYDETRRWVMSERADFVYAFETLCGLFALDVDATRAALLAIVPTGQGKVALPSLRNYGKVRMISHEQRVRKSRWWDAQKTSSSAAARP